MRTARIAFLVALSVMLFVCPRLSVAQLANPNFWITDGLGDPLYFDKWSIFDAGYSPTTINDQGTIKGLQQYSTNYVKDKAVVFVFLAGGASHIETFNPNMDAPAP